MAATLITGANVWDGISAHAAPRQVLVVDGRIQQLAGRSSRRPMHEWWIFPGTR